MATNIISLLTQDEIPIKLRCARCNKLAVNAFRLPCCDQSICESCHTTVPEECPVCSHSPLSPDDCKPNKALRLTVKAFLKGEEKRREKAVAAAAAAEAKAKESVATPAAETSVADHAGAAQTDDVGNTTQHDAIAAQPSKENDASASQTNQGTAQLGSHEEDPATVHEDGNPKADRRSTIERDTPDIQIITGDEQRQDTDARIGNISSQPKSFDPQPQMGMFNFTGFGQNMGWNPAMMQQMLAMQNGMNAGNWGGFPMIGMNGMGMDPSMMNMNMNMMGEMSLGGNNWGWNQQHGMGSMGTENMMNMGGNFNATGGYAKHMASMNNGAGYNAQLMSQHGTSPSHMNNNHGRSMSKDVAGGAAGTSNTKQGDNNATAETNDFLPGDAGDSRPNSPGGQPPQLGLSTEMSNDTSSIQDGESAFSPMTQANGSMNFNQTNGQQINTYMQDSPASSMYPQAAGYGNEYGYNIRGRGSFRGRGFFRGRGGRFNDFDPIVSLTGSGVGQGVEGAPTGPKAMREPQRGPPVAIRGARGGMMGARGTFSNGNPAARTQSFAQSTKSSGQKTPQDNTSRASSRRRTRSRSRSANRVDEDKGEDRQHRREMTERDVDEREQQRRDSDSFDVDAASRRNRSSSRHRGHETSSRRESRRHSPEPNEESERERRRDSHRSSRHRRERSRDRERRHRSSKHHDYDDRSRSRDRDRDYERERRKHRHRSRSPASKEENRYDDDDNEERRSSRHHRHREDRHRDRESEREYRRDKDSSQKESSSRRDRDRDHERHERSRHRSSRDDADHDADRERNHASTSNGHTTDTTPAVPTGPRNDTAIPTGPRGTFSTNAPIPTGPRNSARAPPPKTFRIHGRGSQPSGPRHAPDSDSAPAAQPDKYIDAHALEREARNRERLLKEQQRRGSALATSSANGGSSGGKRRASGDEDAGGGARGKARRKGRGGVKYEDEDGHGRARRVEEEREAARWG